MIVFFQKEKFAYFPIPKVANTSIKVGLRELCENPENLKDYHNYHNKRMSRRLRKLAEGCHKFTVIRDPVARILSSYGNRVIYHKDITRSRVSVAMARIFGVSPEPTLNEYCLNLNTYRRINERLNRHVMLQIDYLGNDLSFFDAIYRIDQLDLLAQDLQARTGRSIKFGRHQTGGPKFTEADLSTAAREALYRYAEKDYQLLGSYFRKAA